MTRHADLDRLLDTAETLLQQQAGEGLQLLEHARRQAEAADRTDAALRARRLSAIALCHLGRSGDSLALLQETLPLAVQAGVIGEEAELLEALGRCHYSTGDYDAAMRCWHEALAVALGAGCHAAFIRAQVGLGQVFFGYERYEAALEHHYKAYDYVHLVDDLVLRGMVYINLAHDLYRLVRLDEAEIALQRAYDVMAPARSLEHEAEVYRMRGLLLLARGNPEDAYASFMAALKICRLQRHQWGELVSLIGLGECLLAQSEWLDARETLEITLALAEQSFPSPHIHYRIHAALAKVNAGLGNTPGVEHHRAAHQRHYIAFHSQPPTVMIAALAERTDASHDEDIRTRTLRRANDEAGSYSAPVLATSLGKVH
ncbi:hypothetical protein SAMN02745857_03376 [Andreprevotia lacus DSM 23236]|uniref:Uncharacterized protein n=1 Tax=Andreprevotia lacus DSM 23236 TaxID=1121001 RepID=A0A1W1XXY5_9NEIS|nr:tetratricopeptide repeat protein [Andreprevotia lacus]SMC28717.1 hypothetical protein SAMN02745857_03376 [Andreprevotia lacus DSM 23236]